MPPPYIPKKVEDIIFYYYAKLIISPAAGYEGNYGFIIDAYKRLKAGKIRVSDYEREFLHLANSSNICTFCQSKCNNYKSIHVVPKSFGVPPGMQNLVVACKSCADSKGEKDLIQWWCKELGRPRDKLPRMPLGLYLKIAYELNKINFSLKKQCNGIDELFINIK